VTRALALALLLAAAPALAADPATLSGPAQVIDGDSLYVAAREVRLAGIDALEWDQTCTADGRSWPCGRHARAFLESLVAGKRVTCAVSGRDRYKRLLATCYVAGADVGRMLVAAGWALAYRRYSRLYVPAEETARRGKAGMWRGDFTPPEAWRRKGG